MQIKMTAKERLLATLRGEKVDRPAVSFYEIGGFNINPNDPDEYNVYNSSSWKPLLQLAENHTDIIRMASPVRANSHSSWSGSAKTGLREQFVTQKVWESLIRLTIEKPLCFLLEHPEAYPRRRTG